jgi:hypothetical protein
MRPGILPFFLEESMNEQNMPKADFYTSIVLTAFGAVVLVMSIQMPSMTEQSHNPYAAPGIVPGLLGAVIALLGGVMFIRSIRKGGTRKITGEAISRAFRDDTTLRMGKTILLCVAYALLLGKLPFTPLTAFFVLIFVLFFEYDRKETFRSQGKKGIIAALLAVSTAAAVYVVFFYLFLVNLP